MENKILIKDINGNPIIEGNQFKFKYLKELDKPIDLKGIFNWNDDELRYEIDVIDSDEYACLSYINNGMMYNFEVIENELDKYKEGTKVAYSDDAHKYIYKNSTLKHTIKEIGYYGKRKYISDDKESEDKIVKIVVLENGDRVNVDWLKIIK